MHKDRAQSSGRNLAGETPRRNKGGSHERHDEARCLEGGRSDGRSGSFAKRRGSGSSDLEWPRSRTGAQIRVLRWKQFIQSEFDSFIVNTKKFVEQSGVKIRVDAESWDDIRPKAAVAANVGGGPDIIMSGHLRSRGANSWCNATLETEICGQRLWERHAEKGRRNVPNRPQRPVLRAQSTEMSGYF